MLTAHSRFWNNHYKQGSHDSYGLKYQGQDLVPGAWNSSLKKLKKREMLNSGRNHQLMSARPFGSLAESFL